MKKISQWLIKGDKEDELYDTPDVRRIDEASFIGPDASEATSTLCLRQNLKRDKLAVLFRHLNVAGNINLVNLGRFRLTTDPKKEPQYFSFPAVIVGFLKQNKQVICLHQKPSSAHYFP